MANLWLILGLTHIEDVFGSKFEVDFGQGRLGIDFGGGRFGG